MVKKVRTFVKDVGANSTEDLESNEAGAKVTVPEGETWTLKACGVSIAAEGRLYLYVNGNRYLEYEDELNPDANNPTPLNIELSAGSYFVFTGTDESGGVNTMAVVLEYDVT